MKMKLLLAALVALACSPTPAVAADNYTVKDSAAATLTICSKDQGGGVQATCHYAVPTENHLGEVGGHTFVTTCTTSPCFTTTSATTIWASGNLIANSATNTSVTPMVFNICRVNGGHGWLTRVRIKVASDTGFAGQSVILKLYGTSPATITNGDRGAWLTSENNLFASVPVTLDQHMTDYEKGISSEMRVAFDCASGSQSVYGLLVASSAITPAAGSKAVAVTLEGTDD